ncbi:MAG: hypothetical protein JKY46_01465 [Robiginitomaculum sp.]|nr:hypothetical protein [Robiginitomaculum sp.]
MSDQSKRAPLLPTNSDRDGPLFFVIVIIVFLASLSAISAISALQNVQHWQNALRNEMTVQIPSGDQAAAERTARILSQIPGVVSTRAATRDEAKALLEPWLGAKNIPDDLPIPLLVYIQLEKKSPASLDVLTTAIANAGINASIDDHQQWANDLARSAKAVQFLSISVLALLITASIAVTGFATRAGLAARRDLVKVLHLVGAKDQIIARLFGGKFIIMGLKAGTLGTLLAMLSVIGLTISGVGAASFMGGATQPGLSPLLALLPAPFITAAVGGWTAYRSVMDSLRKNT